MDSNEGKRLGIFYDVGSASPLSIYAASIDLCEIVFVVNKPNLSKYDINQLDILSIQKNIEVIDVDGLSEQEIFEVLKKEKLSGILTFSEYQMQNVIKYSNMLGMDNFDSVNVNEVTNKYFQRKKLNKQGVSNIQCQLVDKLTFDINKWNKYPAIVKPCKGAGSLLVNKVNSKKELEVLLMSLDKNIEFFIEEYIPDNMKNEKNFCGNYVSVETIHLDGKSIQICITGKFPQLNNYSETGMFLPFEAPDELTQKILKLESNAIKALNIKNGITHTEIKLAVNGPEIIEVNYRLGGYVPELIKRLTGMDMVRIAMENILKFPLPSLNKSLFNNKKTQKVFQYFLHAPEGKFKIKNICGLEEIKEAKGVQLVQLTKNIGDILDSSKGTQNHCGIVYGSAENTKEMEKIINNVNNLFQLKLSKFD